MGGNIAIQQQCVFRLPPLEGYRRLLANYADEWEAADKAKRVDHLRYVWRQTNPRLAIAALLA